MGFAENLNKLCERAKDNAHVVVRKTAFELQGMMIDTSPVRTGRFRSNWAVGLGAINTSADAAPDKTGDSAKGRAQAALQGWEPGQTIYLSNSVSYARALEFGLYGKPPGSANGPKTVGGYSQQASAGIVRLTVQRYSDALAEAVAGLE